MREAKMSSNGRVTIPKAIRDQLDLRPGDRIAFEVRDGELVGRVRRGPTVMELYRRLPGIDPGAYDPSGEATAFARAATENERRQKGD